MPPQSDFARIHRAKGGRETILTDGRGSVVGELGPVGPGATSASCSRTDGVTHPNIELAVDNRHIAVVTAGPALQCSRPL
jgi:hypothetical protein